MKKITILFSLFALLLSACSKQELIDGYPRVVSIAFSGQTSVPLDLVYEGKLVDRLVIGQSYSLAVEGASGKLELREQESKKVVVTKEITSSENFSVYYDGTRAFDAFVRYNIKGYAVSGELEFVLNGQVVGEGSSDIDQTLEIFLTEEETKELQIRLKGETTALITEPIQPVSEEKTLRFFFDGTAIIDEIPELTAPENPDNMSFTATFSSRYSSAGSMPRFTGDAEVDIVFFMTDGSEVTKPEPEIRFTVPTDGRFVTFELPPLPGGLFYTYDIYKKGSLELPYENFDLSAGSVALNNGRMGGISFGTTLDFYYFKAGSSKLIVLQDEAQSWALFPPDYSDFFNVVYGRIQDLSGYF